MAETEYVPAWEARKVMRAARAGALATAADGQPSCSLATPACAPDGSVLLFLSQLSEHTRQLQAEPRCSILLAGAPVEANPQTAPRLTILAKAAVVDDPALKARWLAVHPYAGLYAEFTDFALWRLTIASGMFVGGFARAHRLRAAELAPDPAALAAMLAAEADIVGHCNADHPDALAAIAGADGEWRMVAADVDGCDLAQGEIVRRVAWSRPAAGGDDVRRELIRLARAARA